jgi:hypothetical protein
VQIASLESMRPTMSRVRRLDIGVLVRVFLRERYVYGRSPASPEVPTTIFFLDSEPRFPLPRPETPRIPHRPPRDLQHRLPPDTAISSLDTTTPAEHSGSAASSPVDWLAEAHRSAAEIAARSEAGRAAESPSSPTAPAPWDSRPLLEFTGHGLKLRIPVEIPGDIIDHCFGNMDLGHEQTGQRERFQLGCAFGKQPARGDLFDSLRNPSDPPK